MIVFCTGGRRPAKKFSSGRSNKIFARDRGFGRRPAHGARRARRRRRGGERGREDAAISKHSRLWYYRFPFNHHIRLRHCCACARVRVLSILFTGYYRNLISFSPPWISRNSWNYYSLRELSGVSVWRNLEPFGIFWPTMWWIKLLRLYSRSQKYPFYIISEKISSRSLSNFSNILHTLYFRIISAGNIFLFLTRVTELEYFIFKWGSVDKNGWNSELWKLFWKINDLEMIYVFS